MGKSLEDMLKKQIRLNSNEEGYYSLEELYEKVKPLLYQMTSKFYSVKREPLYSYEDLFSLACLGFIKAYQYYDNLDYAFTTLLSRFVTNEICLELRRHKKFEREISYNAEISDADNLIFLDVIEDSTIKDYFDYVELQEDINRYKQIFTKYLTPREMELWQLGIYEDLKHTIIAKRFGVTPASISKALIKLKARLKKLCYLLDNDHKIRDILTSSQYQIFTEFFMKNKSQSEMAKELGMSQPVISRLIREIEHALKNVGIDVY